MEHIHAKTISYDSSKTRSASSVEYIVIHYTGNSNDTAKANGNYFKNTNTRTAGAHYFVDKSGEIVCSVDPKYTAWSVGGSKYDNCTKTGGGKFYKKCTNANSISIELCDMVTYSPTDAMIASVKRLIKVIQNTYPNATKIIRHFDVTGKSCPASMCTGGYKDANWLAFKKKIV